jgi:hypothetical protein
MGIHGRTAAFTLKDENGTGSRSAGRRIAINLMVPTLRPAKRAVRFDGRFAWYAPRFGSLWSCLGVETVLHFYLFNNGSW